MNLSMYRILRGGLSVNSLSSYHRKKTMAPTVSWEQVFLYKASTLCDVCDVLHVPFGIKDSRLGKRDAGIRRATFMLDAL